MNKPVVYVAAAVGMLAMVALPAVSQTPFAGSGFGEGQTRLRACQSAVNDAAMAAARARSIAIGTIDPARVPFLTARLNTCDCEQVTPGAWQCLVVWTLEAAPVQPNDVSNTPRAS